MARTLDTDIHESENSLVEVLIMYPKQFKFALPLKMVGLMRKWLNQGLRKSIQSVFKF